MYTCLCVYIIAAECLIAARIYYLVHTYLRYLRVAEMRRECWYIDRRKCMLHDASMYSWCVPYLSPCTCLLYMRIYILHTHNITYDENTRPCGCCLSRWQFILCVRFCALKVLRIVHLRQVFLYYVILGKLCANTGAEPTIPPKYNTTATNSRS